MHDAVCVVDRDGAVLAQPLPLESCAEGAHLVLLVLLLLGKLHKHLQDKRKAWSEESRGPVEVQTDRLTCKPTCSKVDWEKLYSSKLKVCLADDTRKED